MSDRIAVMSDGTRRQFGAPEEVYERPTEEFVAGFIGISNLIEGVGRGRRHGPDRDGHECCRAAARTIATPATRSSSPSGPRRSPSTMRSRRGWSR